jgi:hypothetical protein
MSKRSVKYFIFIATAFLVVFDMYLALDNVPGNTYSSRIRQWGIQLQWLPYVIAGFFGLLITHWFGKRDEEGDYSTREKTLLILTMLGVVGAGMIVGLFW